jgi:putative transposase
MRATQMELSLFRPGRGGARPGAGRKRLPAHLRHTPHRARPVHRAAHPVHVTLRAYSRSLRTRFVARIVLGALRDSNAEHFRVAHYSVQENHVHLIVEAEDRASLSSGVRGLMVRVARRVNRVLFRCGKFWADRWHGRALASPREVRNALIYVLQNRIKHVPSSASVAAVDTLSSSQWFHGFAEPLPRGFRSIGPPCIAPARTWLLSVGWRRHGRIHLWEAPNAKP